MLFEDHSCDLKEKMSRMSMLFEDHSCDLKEKMSRMSKEVEDDDQKIDPLSDCQDANNACPVPLVIPLLFMKSFLLPPFLDIWCIDF